MAFPGGTPSLTPGNFPSKLLSVVPPSENAPSCGKVSNRPGAGRLGGRGKAEPHSASSCRHRHHTITLPCHMSSQTEAGSARVWAWVGWEQRNTGSCPNCLCSEWSKLLLCAQYRTL